MMYNYGATHKRMNIKLLFFCAVVAICLIIRDIVGIGLNKFIFVALIGIFLLFSNRDELWCFLCFLIPLFIGLPGTYIRLIALILLFAKNKAKIQKHSFFLMFFFSALEFIASIWYPSVDLIEILGYMATVSIFIFMIYEDQELSHKDCLQFYVYGAVLLCVVIISRGITVSQGAWLDLLSKNRYRFGLTGEEGMHLGANANELAYYCLSGTAVSYCLFKDRRITDFEKTTYLFITIFIAITGLLTLSRSYIIIFAGIVIVYVLLTMRDIRKIGATLFTLLVVLLILIISINHTKLGSNIWSGILVRFARNDLATANDRTTLMIDFFDAFISNFRYTILGTGVTQYWSMLGLPDGYSIHNMLEQVIICLGFPGGLIFLYSIFKPIVLRRHHIKEHKETLLPFLAVILFTQTIQFINPYTHMLHYIMAVYAVKSAIESEEDHYNAVSDNYG